MITYQYAYTLWQRIENATITDNDWQKNKKKKASKFYDKSKKSHLFFKLLKQIELVIAVCLFCMPQMIFENFK